MSFSDRRTPPPAWAVESGVPVGDRGPGAPGADVGPGATVISMGTRRRVVPRPEPESDPRTRGAEPDPHDWAREIALRMLTASPKTRSQLADGLRRKDCPDDVAAAVLPHLRGPSRTIWVPAAMRPVMSGLRHLPRAVFRRLPI